MVRAALSAPIRLIIHRPRPDSLTKAAGRPRVDLTKLPFDPTDGGLAVHDDALLSSLQHAVALAAAAAVTGAARVVQCARKVAVALGADVALARLDP
jgi:hypothetical protein